MRVQRPPRAELRPFVTTLWAEDPDALPAAAARECVLPTGALHLVFRLDEPLRVYADPADLAGRVVGTALVGGARASAYVRDVSRPGRSVGALLHPGAAQAVLGAPGGALAGRHTDLSDLWPDAGAIHAWLGEAATPAARLDRFEAVLRARLPRARGLHPAVAFALERFASGREVAPVAAASGYSQRRLSGLFREAVGLSPKRYCRVRRLQDALRFAAAGSAWAEVALAAGYSDQAHLVREFRELTGLSPGAYRAAAPRSPSHVPLGPASDPFKTAAAAPSTLPGNPRRTHACRSTSSSPTCACTTRPAPSPSTRRPSARRRSSA